MCKQFNHVLFLGVLLFALTACSPPVGDKRDFAEALLKSESGRTIRGSQIGDQSDQVKSRETFDLVSYNDGILSYTGSVEYDKRTVDVGLIYTFDDFGLYEVQFDIFPGNNSDKERIMMALKGKLTMMYGRPSGVAGGLRFTTFSPSNNTMEITLLDESEDYGEPYVSLNFIEPLEDEI